MKAMKLRSKIIVCIGIVFMAMLIFTSRVQANDNGYKGIDIPAIPQGIADGLNIDLFSARLICSTIAILLVLIPMSMIVKSKYGSWIPECAVTLVMMALCISLGWLPVWIFLVFCMLIGLMFAVRMRKVITGGGGGE